MLQHALSWSLGLSVCRLAAGKVSVDYCPISMHTWVPLDTFPTYISLRPTGGGSAFGTEQLDGDQHDAIEDVDEGDWGEDDDEDDDEDDEEERLLERCKGGTVEVDDDDDHDHDELEGDDDGNDSDDESDEENDDDDSDDEDDEDDEDDDEERHRGSGAIHAEEVFGTSSMIQRMLDDPWTIQEGLNSRTGTIPDFFEAYDCSTVYAQERRPIHNESTWVLLRGVYQALVTPGHSSLESVYGDPFLVDYFVDYLPHKGRAVFAAQDIPEGTEILTEDYTARFHKGRDFRRFLASIPYDLACDVIAWCYIDFEEYDDGTPSLTVSVDLDASSFINRPDSLEELNIRGDHRALRDIRAGEELVFNYDDFDFDDAWVLFGLE